MVSRIGRRSGPVLGLAEQVGGDRSRGRRQLVGDHQDLGGAGEQIDSDLSEELALGLGDVGVPRSDQHRHRGDLDSVPSARAARAWTPPSTWISSAPARCMAAIVAAVGAPSKGGVQETTRGTPATLAVTTDMWAEATIG